MTDYWPREMAIRFDVETAADRAAEQTLVDALKHRRPVHYLAKSVDGVDAELAFVVVSVSTGWDADGGRSCSAVLQPAFTPRLLPVTGRGKER